MKEGDDGFSYSSGSGSDRSSTVADTETEAAAKMRLRNDREDGDQAEKAGHRQVETV